MKTPVPELIAVRTMVCGIFPLRAQAKLSAHLGVEVVRGYARAQEREMKMCRHDVRHYCSGLVLPRAQAKLSALPQLRR